MLIKDFKTILHSRYFDEYTKVELLSGDRCIDTFLHNFKMFMTELRRMDYGERHCDIHKFEEDNSCYYMNVPAMYTSGIIRITFGTKGSIVFSQGTKQLIIRIETGRGK